jgi:hypothetical protein
MTISPFHHFARSVAGGSTVGVDVAVTLLSSGVTMMLPLSRSRTRTRAPARSPAFAAVSLGRRRPSEFPHLQILVILISSARMIANGYKLRLPDLNLVSGLYSGVDCVGICWCQRRSPFLPLFPGVAGFSARLFLTSPAA